MQLAEERRFEAAASAAAPRLGRTAFMLCGDRHLAEELVQTTLVKLFRAWPLNDEGALPAWLRTTLVRSFVDETRRPWWAREQTTDSVPDGPAVAVAAAGVDGALMAALERLQPRQRACVVLRFLEDMSIEQTAAVLGCSVGTVKGHTSRGLASLRERLPVAPDTRDDRLERHRT